MRCVVSQVPAVSDLASAVMFGAMLGGDGDLNRFHTKLAEDRRDRALGHAPRYVSFDTSPGTEHHEYWSTFGEAERRNWTPHMTLRSLEPSLATDVRPLMPAISPTPLLMILTEGDFMFGFQKAGYDAALEPKSLLTLPGHHYAAYTTVKSLAIAAAKAWFVEHLLP